MESGRVKFFNLFKGFGYIIPNSGGPDVRVETGDIPKLSKSGLVGLIPDQSVSFEIDPHTRRAIHLSRHRVAGTVKTFAGETGVIELDDDSRQIPVHHVNIVGRSGTFKSLRPGDPVEFEIGPGGEACAVLRLDPRPAIYRFADRQSVSLGKYLHLSRLAEPEEWDYRERPTDDLPILQHYLLKTFDQLLLQDKVLYDEENASASSRACFNTGLVTELQEEILGVFMRNARRGETALTPEWTLEGFYASSDRRLASFGHPEFPLATYFTNLTELFLDPKTRISLRLEHIIRDNLDRFPVRLQSPDAARGALERAFRDAQRRLARNYKTAVPQFYHGQVHLLLPLALEDPQRVDRALVLHRHEKIYKAATIYPLDWAYREARVLAKPDKEWLHPVRSDDGKMVEDEDELVATELPQESACANVATLPVVSLQIGDTVRGRVRRIETYGAFIDIGADLQALCHISELAPNYVKRVEDEVSIDDEISVKVLKIDGRKVAVSRKAIMLHRDVSETEVAPEGAEDSTARLST